MIPSRDEMMRCLERRHTKEVQDRLSAARVAVCGLGGLGSAVAIALARAGIGTLHLIDFDEVDLSNLNRQQYALEQLGLPKPLALRDEIRRFSPYCGIVTDCVKIDEDNAATLLADDDIVCEAFDVPEQKAMLTEQVLVKLPGKPLVGASGMAGYGDGNTIRTRKVMKNYHLCGDGVSGASDGIGLMAPRVMICAAHQANTIIRIILGEER